MAHDAIIEHCMMQAHHTNQRCKPSEQFSPGDLVYLSTKNLSVPKGWAKKLLSKFIGLYKIVEAHTAASTVTLDLPPELTAQRVHTTFHASLIWAHIPNDSQESRSYIQMGQDWTGNWGQPRCCLYRAKSPKW